MPIFQIRAEVSMCVDTCDKKQAKNTFMDVFEHGFHSDEDGSEVKIKEILKIEE